MGLDLFNKESIIKIGELKALIEAQEEYIRYLGEALNQCYPVLQKQGWKHSEEFLNQGDILRNKIEEVRKMKETQPIFNVDGQSVDGDDMHWIVECPKCENEIEYEGYFESGEIDRCDNCGCVFRTNKVWLDDEHYIQ